MSHATEIRVRFYELDPYNHVNHTNYLAYFETARVEYLTDVGYGMDVMKERGFQIVVVELQARFLAAAGLRDVLIVTTSLLEIGRVTSTWSQEMTRRKQTIATLQVKAAFTDLSGRPRRVPEEFAAAFI
jgi:acyl-CoA thioester hydrolase